MEIIENKNKSDKNIYSYIDDEEKETKINVYFKNTYIYGWGKNKYGELGVGHSNNISLPK